LGADGQVLEWVCIYTPKAQPEASSTTSWRERAEVQTGQGRLSKLRVKRTPQQVASNQQPANLRLKKQVVKNQAELAQQGLPKLVNELSHAIVWEADATTSSLPLSVQVLKEFWAIRWSSGFLSQIFG
jgi:hypothetical protein